jgi:beta-1,4-mannosyltransferase
MSLVIVVRDSTYDLIIKLIVSLESTLHPGLVNTPLITIVPLPPPPSILRSNALPFVLAGPLKVLWQIWSLFRCLSYSARPARWMLVQVQPLLIMLKPC